MVKNVQTTVTAEETNAHTLKRRWNSTMWRVCVFTHVTQSRVLMETTNLTLFMLKFIQNVSGENSGYPRSHHMVDMAVGILHCFACIPVHVNEGWMIQDHIAKVPYKGTVQY